MGPNWDQSTRSCSDVPSNTTAPFNLETKCTPSNLLKLIRPMQIVNLQFHNWVS